MIMNDNSNSYRIDHGLACYNQLIRNGINSKIKKELSALGINLTHWFVSVQIHKKGKED